MKAVEVRPAYTWTCEECGRDNFCNGCVVELSEEERMELMQEHDIDPEVTGTFERIPEDVQCKFCGTVFWTYDYRSDQS